ncbi:hypothetical protein Pmani_033341 [Petrolisthes manimaculis]|uniref:Uncharacterized protein n=1 Tax=Petrolisthes manimaculis TaxID=1843537 RepID=A0AAE1TQI7_9EUCA|nr:hypothetical protein Pmani_033341 [Petrolisthes manimaculis]
MRRKLAVKGAQETHARYFVKAGVDVGRFSKCHISEGKGRVHGRVRGGRGAPPSTSPQHLGTACVVSPTDNINNMATRRPFSPGSWPLGHARQLTASQIFPFRHFQTIRRG